MNTLAINHIPDLFHFEFEESQSCNRLLLSAVIASVLIHIAMLFYFHKNPSTPLLTANLTSHSTTQQSQKIIIASVNIKDPIQKISERNNTPKTVNNNQQQPEEKNTGKNIKRKEKTIVTSKKTASKISKNTISENKVSANKSPIKKVPVKKAPANKKAVKKPTPKKESIKPKNQQKVITKPIEAPIPQNITKNTPTTTPASTPISKVSELESKLASKPEKNHAISENYKNLIMARLNQFKHYPVAAKRRLLEDTVLVKFTVNSQGVIIHSSLIKPSAHRLFNKSVERMLKKANPMPTPPAEIANKEKYLTFQIPIEFSLKN